MRIFPMLFLTAAVATASAAFAHEPSSTAGQSDQSSADIRPFAELDKNQDGQLTKDELPASTMHSRHFTKIDADGNGRLSNPEVDKHLADMGMKPGDTQKMDHGMKCMEGMDMKECMEQMEGMEHMEGMKDMEGMEGIEQDTVDDDGSR